MSFDWLKFFDDHSIPYVTTGPNVSAGRAAIKCPFCGPDDPSEHLVVNLRGSNWWCWRRRTDHKGRAPEWLIQNLIHCTFDQARVLTGGVALNDDFLNQIQELLTPTIEKQLPRDRSIELPKEFKPFTGLPSSLPFVNYMTRRGFSRSRVTDFFTKRYGVRYTTTGAFKNRIVFPVIYNGRLVGWTGRTISAHEEVRYKALTTDAERAEKEQVPVALAPINHALLWFDRLRKTTNDTIILTEGPFDALKVAELGRARGVSATCFFTSAPTEPQVELLHELLPRFKRRYIVPDEGAVHFALQTAQRLSSLNVEVRMLPDGVKDPGDLDKDTFQMIL